jgi:hypothetical protein
MVSIGHRFARVSADQRHVIEDLGTVVFELPSTGQFRLGDLVAEDRRRTTVGGPDRV